MAIGLARLAEGKKGDGVGAESPTVMSSHDAFQRAMALYEAGKLAEAEAMICDALARDMYNGDLRNARGVVLAAMGQHLDALWCYRDALACHPKGAGVWTNLGNALTHLKHLQGAIYCHQRAIALSGGTVSLLYHNLATSLAEAGHHGQAILAFTRALELDPTYLMSRWDRGRSYLYLGNYRQAWPDYEVRLLTGQVPKRELSGEKWDGRPYMGKRLVLVVEQGFGDTLWVARYLPQVKALGGELVVECQPELLPLIAEMRVADRLVLRGEPLPAAELHGHLCSLPGHFTQDVASIPALPYLVPPSDRLARLAPLFATAAGRFKVGVIWSGSVTFKRNKERAQPLLRFFQAFALPGVQLYSLQKGPRESELRALPPGVPMIDLAPHLNDFADTAAAVAQLDLVIMTDSAVAHLAGALGKPVWVLLGHVAHWLWLRDRTDSPWYPSLRLFRPRAEGDWDHVFDSASLELMRLLKL